MSFIAAASENTGMPGTEVEVEVLADQVVEVEITRPIMTRLYGVVRDASGPAAGVEVRATEQDSGPLGGGPSATTAEDGSYSIADLTPGTWELTWRRPADPIPHRDELEIPPGQPELLRDLVLTGGELRVRVLDAASGAPLAGARVSLREPEQPGEGGAPAVRGVMMVSISSSGSGPGPGISTITAGDGPRPVTTGPDGEALITGVPPGSYSLRIETDGRVPLRRNDIRITDGNRTDLGDQTLSEAGVVTGTISGFSDTDPVGAATIRATRLDAESEPRRKFANGGTYRLDDLEPGTWEIHARAVGQGPDGETGPKQTVVVLAGETVELDLKVR